jgi:hypothetical protein
MANLHFSRDKRKSPEQLDLFGTTASTSIVGLTVRVNRLRILRLHRIHDWQLARATCSEPALCLLWAPSVVDERRELPRIDRAAKYTGLRDRLKQSFLRGLNHGANLRSI